MINPRDTPPRFGIPVDIETGVPLTDMQMARLHKLNDAAELLYSVLHEIEGTQMPGLMEDHVFQTRRMREASLCLETALLWARRAVVQ